jgi:hypothetical protein
MEKFQAVSESAGDKTRSLEDQLMEGVLAVRSGLAQ